MSSGVDLERFTVAPAPDGPPRFLCVGALEERKNVVRLADAFARLGEGTLTFVGDGPLRAQLEGRDGVRARSAASRTTTFRGCSPRRHVLCQPSLIEPLGQALLEGMACGRSVVATRIGGPPEFVPPDAGVLVDPLDVDALAARCAGGGAARPSAARAAAASTTSAAGGADRGDPRRAAAGRRA